MAATETWTIGRLLAWTTEYLKQQGSESSRLESEILLAHARGCQRIELYTAFDEEPPEEVRDAFRSMVKQRAAGTPVAYLVGHKEFYSATFEVNKDVLIPRPETEHLVIAALDRIQERLASRGRNEPIQVADVGTGSGIIAISIAKHCEDCHLTATDISSAALELAERNARALGVEESRIEFLLGDLLEPCDANHRFDLILSNPPYISQSEYEQLPHTVRSFEPESALLAGPHGSEVIVRLLEQATALLAPEGQVIVELSPMLAAQSGDWLPNTWNIVETIKDLAGHSRALVMAPSHAS